MDFILSIPNYTNPNPTYIPAAIYPITASGSSTETPPAAPPPQPSRYENQKRRDWNTFSQYLRNHRPPLSLALCSGAHVLEFLRYLDQFGKTKVHIQNCPFFGVLNPPSPCPCPFRQAWGSLDALIGRLRAAFEEHGGGRPDLNPFGARAVRLYLREVRDYQAKARGVSYEKKRKRNNNNSSGSSSNNNNSQNDSPREPFLGVAANPRFRISEAVEMINTHGSTN